MTEPLRASSLRERTDARLADPPELPERAVRMARRMMQRVIRITREAQDRTGYLREPAAITTQVHAAYLRIRRLESAIETDEARRWLTAVTNLLLDEMGHEPVTVERVLGGREQEEGRQREEGRVRCSRCTRSISTWEVCHTVNTSGRIEHVGLCPDCYRTLQVDPPAMPA